MIPTVLITGATGFAGSFLVEHYAREGYRVHGTYRTPGGDCSWLPPGVTLHRIDLQHREDVERLVSATAPDIVLHLAAQSSVAASLRDPMETILSNTGSQYHLLEALAVERPSARVLVVGSCDEYGNVAPDENPVNEERPLLPTNPYALSKVTQDLMGHMYFVAQRLEIIRVRPFLQLGPRRADRFVAGSFARQVAEIESGRREPVIRVGNIDLERDFTDVRDVVKAYALAVEVGVPGEVYNIASGEAHSLRHMLEGMLAAAKVRVEIRRDEALVREGEMAVLIGDASRLRALTGWRPTVTFEESVVATLAYWQGRIAEVTAGNGGST